MGLISGGGRRGRGGFGMAHLLLLIIGISWLSFSTVEGVKCYGCMEDGCKSMEMNCDGDTCSKSIGAGGDTKAVAKGCGVSGKDGCDKSELVGGVKAEICNCKGDFCNASTKKYSPSLMILLAASTLTALVTKFGVLRGSI